MTRKLHDTSGFTIIESAFVIAIIGLLLGFSVPSLVAYEQSLRLEAASQSLIGKLRLGQQIAIGRGHPQRISFSTEYDGCSIEDLVTGETLGPHALPRGVTIEAASFVEGGQPGSTLTAQIDGRFSGSGDVVLCDLNGRRDTVWVMTSGQALR